MKSISRIVLGLCAAFSLAGMAVPAMAGPHTPPPPPHQQAPRVVPLGERMAMTDARIEREFRHRRISGKTAARLHRDVDAVRRDERRMSARHRGHLGPREIGMLGARLDRINHRLDR